MPERRVDVVEPGRRARKGCAGLVLDRDVRFSTRALETYAFARWEPVIYDAMVVAAAIEYADKLVKRRPLGWARRLSLRIPVHNVRRWSRPAVSGALHEAIRFLTGDDWSIAFVRRRKATPSPSQEDLDLGVPTEAVLPYSDGMDSRMVAGIMGASLGDGLVRVRVGSKSWEDAETKGKPFTQVPYRVPCDMANRESSSRSRGFKFALISGIAAHLADAKEVVVPESGQGAIGPALVKVGHAYPDYRNAPRFTARMERLLAALLGKDIHYAFPRIWHTKGETLREFVDTTGRDDWRATRSCWQGNRWSSVNGKRRQCGICAACMLRRVAVHAAGLAEPDDTYVWADMTARSLEAGADPDFRRMTGALQEYAIAGVRHMDDLAAMAEAESRPDVMRESTLLAPALGISREEAAKQMQRMLRKHAEEWNSYMKALGPGSFVSKWVQR